MTCIAVQSALSYYDRTDHHTIAEWERTERRFRYKRRGGELYNSMAFIKDLPSWIRSELNYNTMKETNKKYK